MGCSQLDDLVPVPERPSTVSEWRRSRGFADAQPERPDLSGRMPPASTSRAAHGHGLGRHAGVGCAKGCVGEAVAAPASRRARFTQLDKHTFVCEETGWEHVCDDRWALLLLCAPAPPTCLPTEAARQDALQVPIFGILLLKLQARCNLGWLPASIHFYGLRTSIDGAASLPAASLSASVCMRSGTCCLRHMLIAGRVLDGSAAQR